MEKKIETTTRGLYRISGLGIYWDNGRENGNYYIYRVIYGLYGAAPPKAEFPSQHESRTPRITRGLLGRIAQTSDQRWEPDCRAACLDKLAYVYDYFYIIIIIIMITMNITSWRLEVENPYDFKHRPIR